MVQAGICSFSCVAALEEELIAEPPGVCVREAGGAATALFEERV